ncbi:hypothetical protein HK097_001556, partial [Rhizophlyctis rosea]
MPNRGLIRAPSRLKTVEVLVRGLISGPDTPDDNPQPSPTQSSPKRSIDLDDSDTESEYSDSEPSDSPDFAGFKGIALAIYRPRALDPSRVSELPSNSQWQGGTVVNSREEGGVLVQSLAVGEDSVVAHRVNSGKGGITIVEDVATDTVLFFGSTSTSNTSAWRQSPRFSDGVMSISLSSDATPVNIQPLDAPPCSPELLHHLVSLYFQHHHPYFPMIDRMRFLRQLKEKRSEHFSFLLNSMCALVTQQHPSLLKWGVPSVTALHNSFFAQARVLLGKIFDWPHINNIQGLLLLALVGMGTNRNASSYHYIGIAHRQSVELGMHRNLDNVRLGGLGERMKETMRATWFCLYILDRYVGVVEGRPFAVDDEDWDTPLPRQEEDGEVDRMIRHVALCSILGRIANHVNRPARPDRPSKSEIANELASELDQWHQLLPPELAAVPSKTDNGGKWTFHHHLFVMYHTTVILLERMRTGRFGRGGLGSAEVIESVLESLPSKHTPSSSTPTSSAQQDPPFVFVMPVVVYAGLTASTLFLDLVLESFGMEQKNRKRARSSVDSERAGGSGGGSTMGERGQRALESLKRSLGVFEKMRDVAMFSVHYAGLIYECLRSNGVVGDLGKVQEEKEPERQRQDGVEGYESAESHNRPYVPTQQELMGHFHQQRPTVPGGKVQLVGGNGGA